MDIKKILKEYWYASKEMKDLEIRIEDLYKKEKFVEVVETSSKCLPYTKKNIEIESFSSIDKKMQENLNLNLTILKERYNKLLESKIKVEKIINDIPNSRLRSIFTYRYLHNSTWNRVARLINSTSESVRKEHDKYLKKLKK